MIISLRRTYQLLETFSPLECREISPINITGITVRLRIGQYNEKCPLFEVFGYPVLSHLWQFFSDPTRILASNPQALF
jgi:hypothetical protein